MPATNADVARRIVHALSADKTNANAAYSTDPAYPNAAIQAAALDGLAQTIDAILAAPVHGRRVGSTLTTSATVAHGAQVPTHPGRLLGVVVADEWLEQMPASHISRQAGVDQRRVNPLKLNYANAPCFALTGDNRLLLLGAATALLYFGKYERPDYASYEAFLADTLPVGDEYLPAIFFCAMKIIGQEGENIGAMQAYYAEGKSLLAGIQSEGRPTLQEAQLGLGE